MPQTRFQRKTSLKIFERAGCYDRKFMPDYGKRPRSSIHWQATTRRCQFPAESGFAGNFCGVPDLLEADLVGSDQTDIFT